MDDSAKKKWAELLFRPGPHFAGDSAEIIAENLGAALVEKGASGAVVEGDGRVRCFYADSARIGVSALANEGSSGVASGELSDDLLVSCAEQMGFVLCKRSLVGDRNWVQECADVWQPLKIGSLVLQPVLSLEEAPTSPRPRRELRLIPGFGFGTGHHATTAMILGALQTDVPQGPFAPKQALDVGTGSGILALGIFEWFGINVDAVDIDPLALSNAKDNLSLNGAADAIKLFVGDISAVTGQVTNGQATSVQATSVQATSVQYDLVVANLYAEVLETLAEDLAARVAPGGTLILSGIAASLLERVQLHYQSRVKMLTLIRTEIRDEWAMMLLQLPKH